MERYNFKEDILLQNRLLTNNASHEEQIALVQWLNQDKLNQLFWRDLETILSNEEAALIASQVDPDLAWRKIENQIQLDRKKTIYPFNFKIDKTVTRLSIAATFVGIILSSIIYMSLDKEVITNHLATNADIQTIRLDDGSTVTLNSNSQFNYPSSFKGDKRNVELNGEAFFEITKNPKKPFIITTNNLEIKVLGTKFNVDDFGANSKLMQVSVQEGKVEVRSKNNPNHMITLIKGESAILDKEKDTFYKSTYSSFNNAAWKTKIFHFSNNNLKEVFNTLSKAYKMDIEVKDTALLNQHLTASFEKKDINFVMTIISSTFNLNYTIDNEKIIVNTTNVK